MRANPNDITVVTRLLVANKLNLSCKIGAVSETQ